jgi:hypothetical protein
MPPEKSFFCRQVAAINNLDLRGWLFYPGMLFGSMDKWWGIRNSRDSAHEGIDLCFYRSTSGSMATLEPGTLIPILHDGQIVHITDDFLGKTVFVRHPRHGACNRELYSIYGHIRPKDPLLPGLQVRAGDIVGCIAAPRNRAGISAPPPHLHLSAALISNTFPPEKLGWKVMSSGEIIRLIDPLPLLDCDYGILNTP